MAGTLFSEDLKNAVAQLPKVMPNVNAKGQSVQDTSALNMPERLGWGTVPEKAKKDYLIQRGFKEENIIPPEQSPTGEWALKDSKDPNKIFPVDPKGIGKGGLKEFMGDITESVPSALQSSVAVPSKLLELLNVIPGLGTAADVALSGSAEALRQGIGNKLSGRKFTDFDKGEMAMNTFAPAVGKLAVKGLSKLAKPASQETQKGLKALVSAIAPKLEGKGEKMSVANALRGTLSKETLEDASSNPYVRKQLINRGGSIIRETQELADDAAKGVRKAYEAIPKIESAFYKQQGVDDVATKVPIGETLDNMKKIVSEFKINAIGEQQGEAKKALKILSDIAKKSKSGTLTFGQAKTINKQLYDLSSKYYKSGDNGVARLYSQLSKQVSESKDLIPEISKASDKFKAIRSAKDSLEDLLRIDTTRGDLSLENKMTGKLLKSEEGRRQLDAIKSIFDQYPESKPFSEFVDKIKLAQTAKDMETAKMAKPVGWARNPVIKGVQNLLADPTHRMIGLARNVESGRIKPLAGQEFNRSKIPLIDTALNKMRARAMIQKNPLSIPKLPVPNMAAPIGAGGIRSSVHSLQQLMNQDNARNEEGKRIPMLDSMSASLNRLMQ